MTLSIERPPLSSVGDAWTMAQSALVAAGRRLYAEESILIQQTSNSSWIVRDDRVPNVGQNLVGCIDRRDDGYEVMHVGDGFSWYSFDTLDAAVDNLTQLALASTVSRVTDRFAWLS